MANPRNAVLKTEVKETVESKEFNPDSWKYMTLGSLALKDGKNLVREHDISFVLNDRNAEIIRDMCDFILKNPLDAEGKPTKMSINASPFYEGTNENKTRYFSHRIYVSADTLGKTGATFSKYVKENK